MRNRGPLTTLLAVAVAGAAVVATNVAMTDRPAPESTTALGLTRSADGYGGDGYGGGAPPVTTPPVTTPPGAPAPPPGAPAAGPASYDGRTADGETTVALTISEDGVAGAFVSDGKGLRVWLHGTARDGDLTLGGQDAALQGRILDGAAFGTVQVGGTSRPFAAAAAAGAPDAPGGSSPAGDTPDGWR